MFLVMPSRSVEVHGPALREIRVLRGRKVGELAKAVECDRSYITHLEVGTKRTVSPEFYARLCTELGVDHRALLAVLPVEAESA